MNRSPIARHARLEPGKPLVRTSGLPSVSARRLQRIREKGKNAARTGGRASSARGESFPPAVAALLDARDPWCVHCGSPSGLQRHHRRIRGYGGDPRPHTSCACVGVRLCRSCHEWAHSGDGRREAEAEGLIIPRAVTEPWTERVLVHTADGGLAKFPTCDGQWADEPRTGVAA